MQNVGRRMTRLMEHAEPLLLVCLLTLPVYCSLLLSDATAQRPDTHPAPGTYVYEVWQTERGLPHNAIHALHQTWDGYLWLGTAVGLVRFDGVQFTLVNDEQAPHINTSYVWALYEDRAGNLWIGSGSKLSRYRDGQFTTYTTADGLANDFVRAIYEDREGSLWIGTYGGGISRYRDGRFTTYTTDDGLADNVVYQILETRDGTLWAGTASGLSRFDGHRFIHFATGDGSGTDDVFALFEDRSGTLWMGTDRGLWQVGEGGILPPPGVAGLSPGAVRALSEDQEGNLWVGTEGNGLFRLHNGSITDYTAAATLAHDDVRAIYEDREGNLWIGTNGGGLYRFKSPRVTVYGTTEGLASDVAFSVYEDRESAVWIGTSGGLSHWKDGRFTTYTTADGLPSEIVFSLLQGRDGALWIGTMSGGLTRWQDGQMHTYTARDGLPNNDVFALYEDREGALWVGTGSGLARRTMDGFVSYDGADGLAPGIVVALHQDRTGVLWVGTDGGLSRFDAGRFTTYTLADGLPSNHIRTLYEDDAGVLWIGTRGGLARLRDGKFTAFTTHEGLFDDVIYAILEDNDGHLWMSGNKGLSRVGKAELEAVAAGTVRSVTPLTLGKSDGMRSSEANGGSQPAGWKTRDGRLWFSTLRGIVVVDPAQIETHTTAVPVYVEQLLVEDVPMMRSGEPDRRVVVPPGRERFEFQYTALYLAVPEKVHFRYMLDGFDEDWVEAGVRRRAFYTNLSPGPYRFRVQANGGDGTWHEAAAPLAFTLQPHLYQTPWFFALCALVLLGIVAGAYRLRLRRMKAREDELLRLVEGRTRSLVEEKQRTEAQARQLEAQAERLVALDQARRRLFAGLSHELRTPLTLILGPLDDVLAGRHGPLSPESHTRLTIMRNNARRLLRLISNLLDFSRVEAGHLELHIVPGDLVAFARQVVLSFAPLAERHQIQLQFVPEEDSILFAYDPNHLEKILFNLLSNACKFTTAGGKVRVAVRSLAEAGRAAETFAEIAVKDTGSGIAEEDLPHIFDLYRRGDQAQVHEGSGIGLALSKELVELHDGTITVASEPGFGSTFTVRLPMRPAVEEAAMDAPVLPAQPGAHVPAAEEKIGPAGYLEPAMPPPADAPVILIAEDNAEVRAYLRDHLAPHHRVIEAADGLEALEQAQTATPNLIVCDVMMPGLNGFDLLARLRSDEQTRSIPVILLTAKASEESKLEGLDLGADDYLTKPFSVEELKRKVHHLIQVRQELRQQFSREVVVQPSGITVPSIDEAFLEKALAVVEAHMGDSTFGVDVLADEMGLSPRQLQRRLRALTGQAPADFIRHLRLQRAAHLLEQRAGTVAEIAYRVGFNKPAYFSELFRKTFGTSPSEYADGEA